ncbi:MAG TPA: hypothetical protein VK638_28085 [Edaphobacter sp.]|nr:hypothetical protein [Edaphobacter sp.]
MQRIHHNSGLKPESVIRMDQLVVALPLAMVAVNNSLNHPTIRRRLRGGLSQTTNLTLDCCLTMPPDSFRLSYVHWITSLSS